MPTAQDLHTAITDAQGKLSGYTQHLDTHPDSSTQTVLMMMHNLLHMQQEQLAVHATTAPVPEHEHRLALASLENMLLKAEGYVFRNSTQVVQDVQEEGRPMKLDPAAQAGIELRDAILHANGVLNTAAKAVIHPVANTSTTPSTPSAASKPAPKSAAVTALQTKMRTTLHTQQGGNAPAIPQGKPSAFNAGKPS